MNDAPLTQAQSSDHFQIIVGALVAVLVVLIPLVFNQLRTAGKVSRIRDQVENDHPTNLREEADVRHDENARKLDRILDSLVMLRQDVSTLFKADQAQDEQLAALEKTINPFDKETPWTPQKPSPRPWQPAPSPASPPRARHSQTE